MRKNKILIVEDETDVLFINQRYLESKGYEVFAAQTLADAREHLLKSRPDVILLDVMMPDGVGHSFAKEARGITTAPILMLTCLDDNENIITGLSSGADDYITKPYDLEVLHARIIAQLRRAGFPKAGQIELAPLSIDLTRGTATLREEPIHLSPKEMQLLAVFVEHAGREFSAEELYERVWGSPANNSTHTVAVHISALRKKLQMNNDDTFEIQLTRNKRYVLIKTRYEPG